MLKQCRLDTAFYYCFKKTLNKQRRSCKVPHLYFYIINAFNHNYLFHLFSTGIYLYFLNERNWYCCYFLVEWCIKWNVDLSWGKQCNVIKPHTLSLAQKDEKSENNRNRKKQRIFDFVSFWCKKYSLLYSFLPLGEGDFYHNVF